MASDPFCGEASGAVEVHLNVVGSTPFCAKQTGHEHHKSHSNEATATSWVNWFFINGISEGETIRI
jgi:hypothetical protein